MIPSPTNTIIAFDGDCGLCNRLVRFVFANDPAGRIRFLPLQSPLAPQLVGADASSDTVVILQDGHRYVRSDAILHLLLDLRAPWPLGFAAILLPFELRDAVYRFVARNRYQVFGRSDSCPLPPPGLRERFLDEPSP